MHSEATTVLATPYGSVRGTLRSGVQMFSGIRYATAGRFERPVLVSDWHGEVDATTYGPIAPQLPSLLERSMGGGDRPMDEDCLSLNVFAPDTDGPLRPVIVWIHGGGFTTGSGSMPWYDGTRLVERGDVVVVTINYRLGALGFSGRDNLGLRDQIVALHWVHEMIGSFGGDPDNVTIVGESAGGSSVVALMAVAELSGRFHAAFAMSPSIRQLRSAARADETLAEFLEAANAGSLDELRNVPLDQVLAAQKIILERTAGAGLTHFSPCADGVLVADPLLAAAAVNPVPLVIGTTRDEMNLFLLFNPALSNLDEAAALEHFTTVFDDRAADALNAYRDARPDASPLHLLSAMQTDDVFRVPARDLADRRAAAGSPTWMYWFTWASPAFGGVLGSCHAVDIPFVFHNLHRPGVSQFLGEGEERSEVADAYSASLVALAQTGEPGWPAHDTDRRPTMQFDVAGALLHDPETTLRALW